MQFQAPRSTVDTGVLFGVWPPLFGVLENQIHRSLLAFRIHFGPASRRRQVCGAAGYMLVTCCVCLTPDLPKAPAVRCAPRGPLIWGHVGDPNWGGQEAGSQVSLQLQTNWDGGGSDRRFDSVQQVLLCLIYTRPCVHPSNRCANMPPRSWQFDKQTAWSRALSDPGWAPLLSARVHSQDPVCICPRTV